MGKVTSKIFASIITCVMMLALVPAFTLNADTGNWKYDSSTKTLTVSYQGAMPNFDSFVMPGAVNKAPWGKYSKQAEKIVIENGTTTIGANAFAAFVYVTEVVWPTDGKLTTIGANAFSYCDLTEIAIPNGVIAIGSYSFSENNRIAKITFPNTLKTIGASSFACEDGSCLRDTSVVIPSSVTTIGSYAFYNHKKLTSVTGGAGVVTIGSHAFAKCSALSTFKITSKNLKTIGSYAFQSCSKLKTIYITSTTKLTKSTVKNSLKSSSVTTVKVASSKVSTYKTYFAKTNSGKSVTVKK